MSQETNALPDGYRLQEYCIETVLGTGGFGITYKARDTHLDTWVAIKEYFPSEWSYRGRDGSTVHANSHGQVIIPEIQTSGYDWGLDRFLDEARVLARVQHPYVVRVKRYFRANGTAYIVMDYEEGEPLSALLKRQRTLSETQLHGLLGEVLPALEAVHQEGYLHRDIKPSNLYVRARDSCIMLIDFGAARQSLSQRSKSITGLVTPGYSPPEQYVTRSDRYGPWTDIYALGAVLYRCITGKPPAEAPDRQMWDTLVPTVETGAGLYHPGLLAVVDKALAMRPEDRFQSVAKMREALAKAACFDITEPASQRVLQASARRSKAGLQESPTEPSLSSLSHTELALVDLSESPAAAPANKSPAGRAPSVPPGFPNRHGLEAGMASPAESAKFYRGAAGSSSKGAQAEAGAAIPAGSGKPRVPTAGRLERSKSGSLLAAADFDAGRPPGTIAAARAAPAPELLLPSSRIRPDRRQDLLLLVLLIGLLIILGSIAFKIYQNYQSRVTALQQEQLAEETEAARQAALEKTRREQEDARRQEAARHLEQARQAMTVKDWSRAAAYLERADALQPGNPKVAATRAELMEAQRKTSSPVEIWEEPKVNMKLVRLKEGCFAMGSSDSLSDMERSLINETQHQVCLKSFWMGQNEVTNAQFRLFKPDHNSGSSYKGSTLNDDQQPVTEVSWNEAVDYARWLSEQTGKHYRLPTEAEWEYAARAETNTARYWGNDSAEACRYANVADKTAQRVWGANNIHNCDDNYAVAAPVGSFAPNAFQLYDMLGNVSEWTCSEYKSNYDNEETRCSMAGPQSGRRTVRGGSWEDGPKLVRAADRNDQKPDTQNNDRGFRLVREE